MIAPLTIHRDLIAATLRELQAAGRRGTEGMLVWLGRRQPTDVIAVERIYVPVQEASADFFWIAGPAMQALMAELRRDRLMIAAQVHTHPNLAFHSAADDRWAIVRHEGALSLVLPHFALKTTAASFQRDTAVFALTATNEWVDAANLQSKPTYQITS